MSAIGGASTRSQLENMKKFIIQEAREKELELKQEGDEAYDAEKQKLEREGREMVEREFERKMKAAESRKRIMQSNAKNQRRLLILKEQDKAVQRILMKAHGKLSAVSQPGESYQNLLLQLIVQAAVRLEQPEAEVVCRQSDVPLVQKVIGQAAEKYTGITGKQCKLTISSQFLTTSSAGGVVLSSMKGKIICSNTLEQRLRFAFEQQLPLIRETLFP